MLIVSLYGYSQTPEMPWQFLIIVYRLLFSLVHNHWLHFCQCPNLQTSTFGRVFNSKLPGYFRFTGIFKDKMSRNAIYFDFSRFSNLIIPIFSNSVSGIKSHSTYFGGKCESKKIVSFVLWSGVLIGQNYQKVLFQKNFHFIQNQQSRTLQIGFPPSKPELTAASFMKSLS